MQKFGKSDLKAATYENSETWRAKNAKIEKPEKKMPEEPKIQVKI